MRTINTEFKAQNYDASAVRMLLEAGWEDTSWHNDAYPSFEFGNYVKPYENGMRMWRIWIAEDEAELREHPEHKRFSICIALPIDEWIQWHQVAEFDDITTLERWIKFLADNYSENRTAGLQALAEEALRQDALNESGEPHDNYRAINALTTAFQSILTKTQWDNFESFALKATTPEIVSYLMNRVHHQSENQQ